MSEFVKNHPRTNNIYNTVKEKKSSENESFRGIYSNTCVYCGVNIKVIDSSKFEVDHVIPKSILNNTSSIPKYLNDYTYSNIHGIENLVCSCQTCNRWKKAFLCKDKENFNLLHPDEDLLHTIFERNNNFEIEINDSYKSVKDIVEFYDSLRLGNQIRRIDYLLVEINELIDRLDKTNALYLLISDMLRKIERKRRISS